MLSQPAMTPPSGRGKQGLSGRTGRAPKPVRRDDAIRGVPSSCGHSGSVRGRVAALAGPAAHDAIPGARPACGRARPDFPAIGPRRKVAGQRSNIPDVYLYMACTYADLCWVLADLPDGRRDL